MSVVLHVSDPHFGTEVTPVVDALVALARRLAPDVLVLSGDVTQRARRKQFDAARAFVDRLAVPARVVVPGNHDVPLWNPFARAFAPYRGFRRVFGEALEPEHVADDLLVVGLKTTRRRRQVDGELSPEQVERATARFAAAAPGQLRIAVVHQPMAIVDGHDRQNLLHGRALAAQRWAEAGCDLVLGGHIHLPYLVPMSASQPTLSRELWVLQAGTAVSSRVRSGAPNSVNVVRTGPAAGLDGAPGGNRRACSIERWDYGGVDAGFAPAGRWPLVTGGAPGA